MFQKIAVPGPRRVPTIEEGEPVAFESLDGFPLEGRLFRAAHACRRTIVFCHEAGHNMASVAHYGWFLVDGKFNGFTFTFRTESGGTLRRARPWVTQADVDDVAGAIRFLRWKLGVQRGELGLFGVSRGGGSALCAAAGESLVGAVVSDGGFDTRATVKTYMEKWTRRRLPIRVPKLIRALRCYALVEWAQWRQRCRFRSVERAVSHSRHLALLFIHGESDQYSPCSQTLDLYRGARGQKSRELWITAGAGHNASSLHHKEKYSRRVLEFFDRSLVERPSGGNQ
jgi:dipeptidyl aminopeptidase/acylaminoacyl peptidase